MSFASTFPQPRPTPKKTQQSAQQQPSGNITDTYNHHRTPGLLPKAEAGQSPSLINLHPLLRLPLLQVDTQIASFSYTYCTRPDLVRG